MGPLEVHRWFLDLPHGVGLDYIHLDQDWRGVSSTVSCSPISAFKNELVISMLDHVVSGDQVRLSINRKSGASRLVVAVECPPHAAKLPHITNQDLFL